ncbi:MAG TPA: hypothetical protein VHM19_22845 [Polyangiales bacterium]|nr:hypothetical protein [Polyangiales bacterium]
MRQALRERFGHFEAVAYNHPFLIRVVEKGGHPLEDERWYRNPDGSLSIVVMVRRIAA